MTNSGVHIIKRRPLIEDFDAAIRYGMSSFPIGVEGEARNLIEKYGRAEGCASSSAAACGESSETVNQLQARTTNVGVSEFARKVFTDYSGKSRAENVYDALALPGPDKVKFLGRVEDLAPYISRSVRSI